MSIEENRAPEKVDAKQEAKKKALFFVVVIVIMIVAKFALGL